MNEYDLKDTIVALSTPFSKSALAVVRMSGGKSLEIASKICFYANTTYIPLFNRIISK